MLKHMLAHRTELKACTLKASDTVLSRLPEMLPPCGNPRPPQGSQAPEHASCLGSMSCSGRSLRRAGDWQRGLPVTMSLRRSHSDSQRRWQLQCRGFPSRFLRQGGPPGERAAQRCRGLLTGSPATTCARRILGRCTGSCCRTTTCGDKRNRISSLRYKDNLRYTKIK